MTKVLTTVVTYCVLN